MRWLAIAAGSAAALIASGPASAATFLVNVSAPPSFGVFANGRTDAFGSATFPDVILHEGDDLALSVDFGAPIVIPAIEPESFVYDLNIERGVSFDSGRVRLTYPYGVLVGVTEGATGFSIDAATEHVFGPDDPSTTFDINSVSYQINPAPEPYAWALLLVGLGGIGVALRAARHDPSRRRAP
jgi:hypothetical protein